MSKDMWGIDGFGRAFLITRDDLQEVLCMIDGGGQLGVWMIEDQEAA